MKSENAGTPFYGNPRIKFRHDAPDDAKTWTEIFARDNRPTMEKVLGTGLIRTVVSIEGLDKQSLATQNSPQVSLNLSYNYKRIAGNALCIAAKCTITTDGKLEAGWYFAALPSNANKRWIWTINGDTFKYKEFIDFAEYGYWMREDAEGTITETGYFGFPTQDLVSSNNLPASLNANTALGNKATYKGKALGLSILDVDDGNDGRKAVRSGEFTANVTLTATFDGTSSKVEGKVDGFQGNAANTGWSATLAEVTLRNAMPNAVNAEQFGLVTVADAENGRWYARAYGGTARGSTPTKQPTGITGDFKAFFPDGRALGGYATRSSSFPQSLRRRDPGPHRSRQPPFSYAPGAAPWRWRGWHTLAVAG